MQTSPRSQGLFKVSFVMLTALFYTTLDQHQWSNNHQWSNRRSHTQQNFQAYTDCRYCSRNCSYRRHAEYNEAGTRTELFCHLCRHREKIWKMNQREATRYLFTADNIQCNLPVEAEASCVCTQCQVHEFRVYRLAPGVVSIL